MMETSLLDFSFIHLPLTLILAILLDKWLGEARNYHYLVGFGTLATALEKQLNLAKYSPSKQKLLGSFAWLLMVLPIPLGYWLGKNYLAETINNPQLFNLLFVLLDSLLLYLAIGLNSLRQHAFWVYEPLIANDLTTARHYTGYLVSRETDDLSEQQMARATTESMLENGHDAVLASLFYYLIGGMPLVIMHRFANTLDAMWGYKNDRFLHFGFFAAKADDALGYISSKASAVLYALCALFDSSTKIRKVKISTVKNAIVNAAKQAPKYKSLNGGWAMAAGATVLGIQLGGKANYHGKVIESVPLGQGSEVQSEDIKRSVILIETASMLLVALVSFTCVCQLAVYHLF